MPLLQRTVYHETHRSNRIMADVKKLEGIREGEVIAMTNKDGVLQDFGFVKEIHDIGFVVTTAQGIIFFRFDGTAPGTKLHARRATEQEAMIHRIRRTSAKAFVAIGPEHLKTIYTLLKNAEE